MNRYEFDKMTIGDIYELVNYQEVIISDLSKERENQNILLEADSIEKVFNQKNNFSIRFVTALRSCGILNMRQLKNIIDDHGWKPGYGYYRIHTETSPIWHCRNIGKGTLLWAKEIYENYYISHK